MLTVILQAHNRSERLFLTIPYISENLTQVIKRMLKKTHFNIQLSTSNRKIKNIVKRNNRNNNNDNNSNANADNNDNNNNGNNMNKKKCNWGKCILKNDSCYTKMIVYKLECYTCHKMYIGSTIRPFHVRYMEHVNNNNGIIKIHSRYCIFPNFVTEVMDRVYGDAEIVLRIKEAIKIKEYRPSLNTKEEINTLMDILTD